MSKNYEDSKTKINAIRNKEEAVRAVSDFLSVLSETDIAKMDKISYWLKDYINYLEKEENFTPAKLKKYKRGDIIKVNLGFNVGSEEGGLHYCVVVGNDSIHNPTINVIPLTSKKTGKAINHKDLDLGNILKGSLNSKLQDMSSAFRKDVSELNAILDNALLEKMIQEEIAEIENQVKQLTRKKDFIDNIRSEMLRLNSGSIALVSQITTVSKIKIYDPKTTNDILHGIRLDSNTMDLIDAKIVELYTKPCKSAKKEKKVKENA